MQKARCTCLSFRPQGEISKMFYLYSSALWAVDTACRVPTEERYYFTNTFLPPMMYMPGAVISLSLRPLRS